MKWTIISLIPQDTMVTTNCYVYFQTVKINKWDGAAAKNAIDDAIREVTIIFIVGINN